MGNLFIYVVARDFGFAPNPFHRMCTLATCKPKIRTKAQVGDWVIGVGGSRLKATGRCIFAMKVTDKITFNEYWNNPAFADKKPVRNGSQKMMVGDNIYFCDPATKSWAQLDSHHSFADGSVNPDNLKRDTSSENVLISRHFYYFGLTAPIIPSHLLAEIGYKNGRGHKIFDAHRSSKLLDWLDATFGRSLNIVQGDPFDFEKSKARYSTRTDKISYVAS